jgi:hypothetical protein
VRRVTQFLETPSGGENAPAAVGANWIGGYLRYANVGSVPARIARIEATIFHAREVVPDRHMINSWPPEKATLAAGEEDFCAVSSQIAEDDLPDPADPLYMRGRIIYVDGNNVTRETGFCRRYDMSRQHWVRVDDPELDYAN